MRYGLELSRGWPMRLGDSYSLMTSLLEVLVLANLHFVV